jgi:hypothetical protein
LDQRPDRGASQARPSQAERTGTRPQKPVVEILSPGGQVTYWIIEHASHGTLTEFEIRFLSHNLCVKFPHFTSAGMRSDGTTHRFYSLAEAQKALEACRISKRPGMNGCYILQMLDVAPYVRYIRDSACLKYIERH